jgi:hypothetical protein
MRRAVYATQHIDEGSILIEESPLLTFDPRNKSSHSAAAGARDPKGRKVLSISTLEMQLPYQWICAGRTDQELSKLGFCHKTNLLPENEFLQDMNTWSEEYARNIYSKYESRCITDVLLVSERHPDLRMQMIMRVRNKKSPQAMQSQTMGIKKGGY